MLNIKQVHLLIEEGLNTLGMFTEQGLLHEQVDLNINHVVEKHIRDLKDTPAQGRSELEKAIIRFLTVSQNFPVEYKELYYEAEIPNDFGDLTSSYSVLGQCDCACNCSSNSKISCKEEVKDKSKIEANHYYKTVKKTKYNNNWLDADTIFKGLTGISTYYGEVEEIKLERRNNINTTIDSLESYSLSSLVQNSFRPLLAWDENKFYIYYNPPSKRKKELVLELNVNYIRTYSDDLKPSWCNGITLGFPSEIQRYYIDLTIAYIAMINKQEQQNIVNLKAETI